jgi:hypothetical protein
MYDLQMIPETRRRWWYQQRRGFAVLFRTVAIWRAIQNKTANYYVIEIDV